MDAEPLLLQLLVSALMQAAHVLLDTTTANNELQKQVGQFSQLDVNPELNDSGNKKTPIDIPTVKMPAPQHHD